ncbi:MAG TPA: peptide-methionine (R)-S-oxide reductase, partial [Ramlibacter sp.]|nr:peptide-methionine (R)-S-oxide reductase [Ramlibacter sp.]
MNSEFPIQKTEAEWKELLARKGAEPGALQVTRHAATERPFTGK